MDKSEINFSSKSNVTLLNPRFPTELQHTLRTAALSFPKITGHFWLATSGSTGGPKLVALSKEAILSSAESVNKHLELTNNDIWGLTLPLFHVGGLGVLARAHLTGAKVKDFPSWSALDFVSFCEAESVTVTSLVPTHIFDIISLGIRSPRSLRAVIVGGGVLSSRLYMRARELGWPLLPSFGMTEYCSQIATADPHLLDNNDSRLQVLPHVSASTNEEGRLVISGPSLFTGYAHLEGKKAKFINPIESGKFITEDLVDLNKDGANLILTPKGRASDVVKVNGELVSLLSVNSSLQSIIAEFKAITDAAVVAIPNARAGSQLILAASGDEEAVKQLYETLRKNLMPYERPTNYLMVSEIPKSALGKISLNALSNLIKKNYSNQDA